MGEIKIRAAFPNEKNAISFDGMDGGGLKIVFSQNNVVDVMKLVSLRGTAFDLIFKY